jgi:hypothetical protein
MAEELLTVKEIENKALKPLKIIHDEITYLFKEEKLLEKDFTLSEDNQSCIIRSILTLPQIFLNNNKWEI